MKKLLIVNTNSSWLFDMFVPDILFEKITETTDEELIRKELVETVRKEANTFELDHHDQIEVAFDNDWHAWNQHKYKNIYNQYNLVAYQRGAEELAEELDDILWRKCEEVVEEWKELLEREEAENEEA